MSLIVRDINRVKKEIKWLEDALARKESGASKQEAHGNELSHSKVMKCVKKQKQIDKKKEELKRLEKHRQLEVIEKALNREYKCMECGVELPYKAEKKLCHKCLLDFALKFMEHTQLQK